MGRAKPGHPRRERPEQRHDHCDGMYAEHGTFAGHPVDGRLLDELVGAAIDACPTCQAPLLALLAEDPATTAKLAAVACTAVHDKLGGLPSTLLDADPHGVTAPEFQQLARAGVDVPDENLVMTRMWSVANAMTSQQRWAAANTALDLLVGML